MQNPSSEINFKNIHLLPCSSYHITAKPILRDELPFYYCLLICIIIYKYIANDIQVSVDLYQVIAFYFTDKYKTSANLNFKPFLDNPECYCCFV